MPGTRSIAVRSLRRYPGFRQILLFRGARTVRGFQTANTAITASFIILISLAALHDRAIILPGPATGYAEHPAIWVLYGIQIYLPAVLLHAIDQLWAGVLVGDSVFTTEFTRTSYVRSRVSFIQGVRLKRSRSRIYYILVLTLGIFLFVWNSYWNQHPERLGHDFWDSINFPWCYAITRIYKCYVWVIWFPALAHLQLLTVLAVRTLFIRGGDDGGFVLFPFHADGCGGVKGLMSAIVDPLSALVLSVALLNIGTFLVHGQLDMTSGGGFVLVSAGFVVCYLTPALSLRKAIRREKARQLQQLAERQDMLYRALIARSPDSGYIHQAVSTLRELTSITNRVRAIPEWPQFVRVTRLLSITTSSQIVVWAIPLFKAFVGGWVGFP
jgi:hypothetical protein